MLTPFLTDLIAVLLLCRVASSQYSSDQCSWRGSGLTHESHTRDVEQVYLRCSEGNLEWLYPTGALIVNLRPNTLTAAYKYLTVCIKPLKDSKGANIYLEKSGDLKLLIQEQDHSPNQVYCYGIDEGSLRTAVCIQCLCVPFPSDVVPAVGVKCLPAEGIEGDTAPCRPCSDTEILLAVCTSDFVARGTIRGVTHDSELQESTIGVSVSKLYRQKSKIFRATGMSRRWLGQIRTPLECGVNPGNGDFLFMGSMHFGEARLGCAPRFKDFQRIYKEAKDKGQNPCEIDTD
ncbi:METRL protein, partial [Polyodon spathula]|nr:METRL protein [Polyodon spathula]